MIVFGTMEATLTPLMVEVEAAFPGIKVFSLPSVDHPEYGRHIELGVKGRAGAAERAFERACSPDLQSHGAKLGPMMVR